MLSNNNKIVNQPHLAEKRTFNREFMVTDKPTLKESRVHYYYRCLEFYDNLKGICLLLFNYPIKKEDIKIFLLYFSSITTLIYPLFCNFHHLNFEILL